jgi:ribosome biogenesis GTPase / thiamine phosphate phosphatase
VNARDPDVAERLKPWLGRGQTIALMGSSGVGKSTIVNSLMQDNVQGTQGIREDDARGRHTTSGRSLHLMPSGAWLMDTPGMREIQVVDVADGIDTVFDDVTELIAQCRFSDCHHQNEPGCAVREAIEAGTLDPARLLRFEKLKREERYNSEELHVAHARNKAFGKMTRKVGDGSPHFALCLAAKV